MCTIVAHSATKSFTPTLIDSIFDHARIWLTCLLNLNSLQPTAAASAGSATLYEATMPPLHGSCHKGSSREVRKLVSMGEDVNEQVPVDTMLTTKLNPLSCL